MNESRPPHRLIGVEEFLIYYHKAYQRDNIDAMNLLGDLYPDVGKLAFDLNYISKRADPADEEALFCRHPITVSSIHMTEARVLDMAAYLCGKTKAPAEFRVRLQTDIPFREVFNFAVDRFQRDYDRDALWDNLFMQVPEFEWLLEKRKIRSLMELEYRASEYFALSV